MLNLYTLHPRRTGQFRSMDRLRRGRLGRIRKSPVFRIVAVQFIATLLAAVLGLAISRVAAWSALLAGAACIIPGLYVLAMSERSVPKGTTGLANVIRGEAGKYALTIAILALVFVFVRPLNGVAFFTTFICLQVAVAVVPLLEARALLNRGGAGRGETR